MKELGEYLGKKREAMVHYAASLMAERLGKQRAAALAEDVVQQACLRFLERAADGREPVWRESRFVAVVRWVALDTIRQDSNAPTLVNTAETGTRGRGPRGRKRRSRVTNTYPSQVFGVPLVNEPMIGVTHDDGEDEDRDRAA